MKWRIEITQNEHAYSYTARGTNSDDFCLMATGKSPIEATLNLKRKIKEYSELNFDWEYPES